MIDKYNNIINSIFNLLNITCQKCIFKNECIIYNPKKYALLKRIFIRYLAKLTDRIFYDEWNIKFNTELNFIKHEHSYEFVIILNNKNNIYLFNTLDDLCTRFNEYNKLKIFICNIQLLPIQKVNNLTEYLDSKFIDYEFIDSNSWLKIKFKTEYFYMLEAGVLLTNAILDYKSSINTNNYKYLFIYSDHDHYFNSNHYLNPVFKPDWNYDYFLEGNYLGKCVIINTELIVNLSEKLSHYPDINITNFVLSLYENHPDIPILHIQKILFHEIIYSEKLIIDENNMHSDYIRRHFKNMCINAELIPNKYNTNIYRVKRGIEDKLPLISIVILTKNNKSLLEKCIKGIVHNTNYQNIEINLIDNGSNDAETLSYLESLSDIKSIKIYRIDREFNYSLLINQAVDYATGDYLLFLNDDISIIDNMWLTEMASHILREDIGIVGARLLFPNNTIQHGGVILGITGGIAGHAFKYFPEKLDGYIYRLIKTQQLSCVTAACMLTKKSIFKKAGGFDEENLGIAYNDVDYCLKVNQCGFKVIWTPFAELYHYESATRGHDLLPENIDRFNKERIYMKNKWNKELGNDPFYNINLTDKYEDFSLANPPRK